MHFADIFAFDFSAEYRVVVSCFMSTWVRTHISTAGADIYSLPPTFTTIYRCHSPASANAHAPLRW